MPTNIMLDLETMGTSPDAAVVAIGAVAFDLVRGKIVNRFSRAVSLESSAIHGGVIDASTVQWWLRQSDAARSDIASGGYALEDALEQFADWALGLASDGDLQGKPEDVIVWGNGADFDNVILRRSYARVSMRAPWGTYNNRCYRTVKALRPDIKLQRIGTHHRAVDDAESQALHLMTVLGALGLPAEGAA